MVETSTKYQSAEMSKDGEDESLEECSLDGRETLQFSTALRLLEVETLI